MLIGKGRVLYIVPQRCHQLRQAAKSRRKSDTPQEYCYSKPRAEPLLVVEQTDGCGYVPLQLTVEKKMASRSECGTEGETARSCG